VVRTNIRLLVLRVFQYHGPLTDAQLAWWMEDVLQKNAATAKRKRWELSQEGMLREVPGKALRTAAGRFQKLWELAPGVKPHG
jgi:hypothetical protein